VARVTQLSRMYGAFLRGYTASLALSSSLSHRRSRVSTTRAIQAPQTNHNARPLRLLSEADMFDATPEVRMLLTLLFVHMM
jgi:hypothetical protein